MGEATLNWRNYLKRHVRIIRYIWHFHWMTRALFLKLYPFYIPNNSIDFCGIYYIVICIRGVLNNETLLNHVKKKKKIPQLIKSIAFFHITWHHSRHATPSLVLLWSSLRVVCVIQCALQDASQIWSDRSNRQKTVCKH